MSFLRIMPQKQASRHCHVSQWHEREKVKERKKREEQLVEATEYCIRNGCKGYTALASGLFPLIKDPRTINRRIEDKPGQWRQWVTVNDSE